MDQNLKYQTRNSDTTIGKHRGILQEIDLGKEFGEVYDS